MKHGWQFMDALTLAIESWSGAVLRSHPTAFLHRGADLRYAVERSLFFMLANDAGLQEYFDALSDGQRPQPLAGKWTVAITPYLAPPAGPLHIPTLAAAKRLRGLAGNFSRLVRRPYVTARLPQAADVLLLAIHPKFVSFLAPVAQALGPGAAFLSVGDPVVEDHLAAQTLPAIALRPAFSWPNASPVLRHFPDLCGWFDRMAAMMDEIRPSAVLVPEGNAPIYEIANRAGQQRGVATVCLQHGGHSYTNPGFRNWTFTDFLVWGSSFAEPFIRHNPTQHFTITGTPAELPPPRAAGTAVGGVGFFLQKGATLIAKAEWEALLDLISWTAETFPGIEIIVRDHPTQPHTTAEERARLGTRSNIRFMPPPHFTLNDALRASDVVVAAASTTLLEAIPAGAIPLIFGTAYPKDYPDIVGKSAAIRAADFVTAKTAITMLIGNSEVREKLRAEGRQILPELFAANGSAGAQRIAAALRTAKT